MDKKIVFFSDIDDTLIFSKRKINFEKELEVGGYDKNNEPFSYFYKEVKELLDIILEADINFIPNTARNLSSYKRTIFYSNKKIKYAILNFGAVILENNKINKEWEEYIQDKYKNIDMFLLSNDIKKLFNFEIDIKIIDGFYISIYNRFHRDEIKICDLIEKKLLEFIKNRDLEIYLNKNSFAIYPNFIGKAKATEFLIKKLQPKLVMSAGDSNSDIDFMKLSNLAILPTNSSLFNKLS